MQNSLKEQMVQLFQQLDPQLSTQQKNVLVHVMNELLNQADLLAELQAADQIIQNCINTMTDNQRFKVSEKNCADGMQHGWSYRTEQRKQLIVRAQRILGVSAHE